MNRAPVTFIHADPHLVVVDKAGGFLSVPGKGPDKQDCVAARVRQAYPACISHPAVHRLDMDTSGLLVMALTAQAQRTLSIQFQQRTPRKAYVALLEGVLEGEEGTVELPFRLDVDDRPRQIHDPLHGKVGITHWRKLGVEEGFTRVRFVPVTGRTHQLRVHAAHSLGLGLPIVGDALYGTGTGPGQLKLHAAELGFEHPENGVPMFFESPPPF